MAVIKLEEFLDETTKQQAIQDYVLKNKKLSKEIIDKVMYDYLYTRIREVFYGNSRTTTTKKAIKEFNTKVETSVSRQVNKILKDVLTVEGLLSDSSVDTLIKKRMSEIAKDNYYYQGFIRDGIEKALAERTKEYVLTSGFTEKYDKALAKAIDAKLEQSNIDKDAERILDAARRLK